MLTPSSAPVTDSSLSAAPANDTATLSLKDVKKHRNNLLKSAVHNHSFITGRGILERLFSFMFRGFVYPQIWEDPEVDLDAMQITPDCRIFTIASGGCNIMNYLTADPESITAVDLNPAHVALTKLNIAALTHLPTPEMVFKTLG